MRLGLQFVVVLVVALLAVLLAGSCMAPSPLAGGDTSPDGINPLGDTWNTWTAAAKTQAVVVPSGTPTASPSQTPTVMSVAPTPSPLASGGLVLALTPGPDLCGRLCVAGLPAGYCWDVCFDASYRVTRGGG